MKRELFNLTNPQKSIWLTEQYCPGTSLNNISGNILIDEKIDFELLEKALNLYVKKNDAVRLKLTVVNSEVKQYVDDYKPFKVDIFSVNNTTELDALSKKIISTPFTLLNSNLFNFVLFKFTDGSGGININFHHLICDAWTMSLLISEIISLYSQLLKGEEIDTSLNSSYIDFIRSEQEYLASTRYINDAKFWEDEFNFEPEIYSMKPIQHINQFLISAERKAYTLSNEMKKQIQLFCTEHNCSLYTFLMAIYSIYLSKINNVDFATLGTFVLNRKNFKDKHTAGMFISTVPFNTSIDYSSCFTEFVTKLNTKQISIFRHQKYPYNVLLESLRNKYSNLPNLYDVVLSCQNARNNHQTSDIAYHTKWFFNNCLLNSMDIHIYDMDDSDTVNIYYDYQIEHYSDRDIEQLHNRILFVMEQILSDNSILIKDIDIVTPDEKEVLIHTFNTTDSVYPKDVSIQSLFEEQVKQNTNKTALIFEDTKLSYSDLNVKANQVAHYLREELHVKPNQAIGLMLPRCSEMIIGILGIIKSGAAYIPIDPEYPQERIEYMLSNSNSKLVLVNDANKATSGNYEAIDISFSSSIYDKYSKEDLPNVNHASDLLYTIYTSGSTGKPKGVMLTHQNIHNYLHSLTEKINFASNKTMVSVTTICFDIFVTEIFGSLTNGLTLVLANEKQQNIGSLLKELCCANQVNMIQTTPSRFNLLLDDAGEDLLNCFSDLLVGGEPLPKPLLERLYQYSNLTVYNMYGPTETAVWSTIKKNPNINNISIGKPIANTQIYILDRYQKLLPAGIAGELYIGGDGVSKGYYNRPDLTEKNFISSPFEDNKIIYNTNDLAYIDCNGELFHLGRTDFQTKINGFRIELEEIENVLNSYPSIEKASVVSKNNTLLAFYVANEEVNFEEVVHFLLKQLPHYMIPKNIIKVDSIPLTPNGKTDKKKLLQIEVNELTKSTNVLDIKPINKTEEFLLKLFHKHVDNNISITSNFFEYGADSLSIIKILSELYKNKIVNVKVQDFYTFPTIRLLAGSLTTDRNVTKNETKNYPTNLSTIIKPALEIPSSSGRQYILLTGVTGFLGIHLLAQLLDSTNYNIFCLIREKNGSTAKERLCAKLDYYFDGKYKDLIDKRIIIYSTNITQKHFGLMDSDYKYIGKNTFAVLHAAADVRHYGNYEHSKKINITATKNMISFCMSFHCILHHISTMTVSGYGLVKVKTDSLFDENSFYINQKFSDNIYVKTKFLAENYIYAAVQKGLIAKIYRIGNLTNRYEDGLFQENAYENGFINRLRAIKDMQMIPSTFHTMNLELSPVDITAHAIFLLMQHPVKQNVEIYHLYNIHDIPMNTILQQFAKNGLSISCVEDSEFMNYLSDHYKSIREISGFIGDSNVEYYNNSSIFSCQNTMAKLEKNGFIWPTLSESYIQELIKKL